MWAFLLNRYVIGGVAVLGILSAVFWAGDHYGWNARRYADCKAETARRNAAISHANAVENRLHDREEAARTQAANLFAKCPGIQQCIETPETAACLDLLPE